MPIESGLHASFDLSLDGFRLEASFDIAPGETLALVGPSGAGKSTCIGTITGLLRPRRGRILLDGKSWLDVDRGIDLPPHERHVGLVPQADTLFPHLDVRGNVAYGAQARGMSRKESAERAGSWLDRLGLSRLADRPVSRLSGGERQRAALARALASGARVLLLDEPFGSLDITTRASVRGELRRFLGESDIGLPVLFVTHDPTDALVTADRIAVLEAGRVTQMGSRDELLAKPRTSFIAEMLGRNHYRALLPPGRGVREVRVGDAVFHVLAGDLDGTISLAFPPSAVTLSIDAPKGSAQNTFRGTIREVLPLADRTRVVLDAGITLAADVVPEVVSKMRLMPGAIVWASVKATSIEVYP